MTRETDLQRVVAFYETVHPDALARLDAIYSPDAVFKDPFNAVRGRDAIARIFIHMFARVDHPRFIVTERVLQGNNAFLVWDFQFTAKGKAGRHWQIHGVTHLRFRDDGLVDHHRDYWDAAEELYEKVPLLGPLMRCLRRATQR